MIRFTIHACAVAAMSALCLAAPRAHAASLCVDIAIPKGAIAAHGGKWADLTTAQWQFLRGVFVLNPNTPPGLPYGDKAALAQIEGDTGGLAFFIDGEMACEPMAVPRVLIEMLREIAAGTIRHEGTEN